VLAASLGSVAGVLLLDLVCRKGGEEGLKKMMTPKRLVYLKNKMQQHSGIALIIACFGAATVSIHGDSRCRERAPISQAAPPRRGLLVLGLFDSL